jgi:CBS domain-containing protein
MEAEALRFLAEHVRLAHYPKGALILSSEMGVARALYIMQRGKVRVKASGGPATRILADHARSRSGLRHRGVDGAAPDFERLRGALRMSSATNCRPSDFFALTQKSTVFNLFCTQYIAGLLKQSQQQLQLQFAQRAAEQKTMNSPLASIVKREPVSVPAEASIRQVVELMADRHLGSMVIVDAGEQPVGIFTLSDVLKRIVLARQVARSANFLGDVHVAADSAVGGQRPRCRAGDGHAWHPPRAGGG